MEDSVKTRVLVALALLGLTALAVGCTAGAGAVTLEEATLDDTITAQGSGEAWAAPDMAEVSFGVTKQAEKPDAALTQASQVASGIVDAVIAAGVDKKDLQTEWMNLQPQYSGGEDKAPVITGYEATVMVKVKVRDIDALGSVMEAATKAGATNVAGLSFVLDDDATAQDEAITTAVDDARARAESMAAAADRQLGKVLRVSETAVYQPYGPNYSGAEYARAADSFSAALQPGQIQTSANVTVVFDLR